MAEQAIAAVKTVKQLNGEQFEADRYAEKLTKVTKNSTKYGIFIGVGLGSLFGFMLCSYGLGFWYGSHCVQGTDSCPPSLNNGSKYSAGSVLVIFFSILMAGFNFTQLTPAVKKISQGRSAAARIFTIIDRQPLIHSPANAVKPESFKGVFRFEDVTFAYPKDPNRNIVQGLTLEIKSKSTAFVGESGCGKSTIFQLMMRFYDPDHGRITLDGRDLRDLDLYWLRQQIGYVGQEPVLFAASLRENLLFGKEDATQEEIDTALKKAEAYDFVYGLKDNLETFAGTAGSQISGGQKQRLAIARALLKDPKILLLDEATSALDRRNEKNIQATLNKIAAEKTTVTIAHRVNTIMSCDEIYVLDKGTIVERGRFKDLERYRGTQAEAEDDVPSPEKAKEHTPGGFIDFAANLNTQHLQGEKGLAYVEEELNEEEQEKKRKAELVKKYEDSVFSRLFTYSTHRKGLMAIGIAISIINGVIFPVFSIFLAKMLAILINFNDNPSQARQEANYYSIIYVCLGVLAFVMCVVQMGIFATIGEETTQKIRN
jgi:ATP-binding cassette subfamily B (MDR/TAP) protein 1